MRCGVLLRLSMPLLLLNSKLLLGGRMPQAVCCWPAAVLLVLVMRTMAQLVNHGIFSISESFQA
jgi:hypothetical protein